MNYLRKIVCMLICMIQIAVLSTQVFAENINSSSEESDDIEVVLLFDVSGSMKYSDPMNKAGTRMSIEAAYQFVFNYPSEDNMYVTVVPYHSMVYTELETVNVSTIEGRDKYFQYMEYMLNNTLPKGKTETNSSYNVCWTFQTDIGGALEEAKRVILESNRNGKKAVILFTDGTAELETVEKTKESENKAINASVALREADIPVYSIGLNYDGSVNKNFLYKLSGEENTEIVESTNDLAGVFAKVYTYLVKNSFLRENIVDGGDEINIYPNKETEQKIRIYGQAVKEANISFSSKVLDKNGGLAQLNSIKVTTPSNTVVADVDLKNPENSRIKSEYCLVNFSPSGCSATIKLLEPMDGDWTVAVTGEEGTLIVKKINLFDLEMRNTLTVDEVFVDETINYEASIYNSEKNIHLTSPGLYSAEDGALAIVEVSKVGKELFNGVLNKAGSGFDFSLVFDEPGQYILKTKLSHAEFELSDEKQISVVGPELKLTLPATSEAVGATDIPIALYNPLTGKKLTYVPEYLKGTTIILHINKNEEPFDEIPISVNSLQEGEYLYTFKAEETGLYSFKASLDYHEIHMESDNSCVNFVPSVITATSKAISSITDKSLSGKWSKTIDLSEMFIDSDGDKVDLTVEEDDATFFMTDLDGASLTIRTDSFGEAAFRILVTDGKGAEYRHEIQLKNVSLIPLLIGCCAAVVAIAIGIVAFILILRKKSIISFRFKIKIELAGDIYTTRKAVYVIAPITSRKTGKPKMTLDEILVPRGFGTLEKIDGVTEDEIRGFIQKYGKSITLSGVPFKRAILVEYKEPGKKKARSLRFTTATQTMHIARDVGSIAIGKSNAEL